MGQEAFDSSDPGEWLRHARELMGALQPGPEQGRQLQQAFLAFLQARKEGAREAEVKAAQLEIVEASLQEALAAADQTKAADLMGQRSEAALRWNEARSRACDALLQGEWQAAQAVIRSWLSAQHSETAPAATIETLTELHLNACSAEHPRLPGMWLVEGRSLPRSGHHYLKSLFARACGDHFSYCEGYQEPGCCRTSPCHVSAYWHFARDRRQPHLRLLKSHDFHLEDATFEPPMGMVRLVQVRRPLHALVSWLELEQLNENRQLLQQASLALERIYLYHEAEVLEEAWRLIDQAGVVMTSEQVSEWLNRKVRYVVGFLQKWLPLAKPFPFGHRLSGGDVLLRYEDLGRSQELLESFGLARLDEEHGLAFTPRHPDVMQRRSARVAELIQAHRRELEEAEAVVFAEVPSMQELYPVAARV
ncbi:hypothetical protein [Cyanobium sp. Lug-B]|uniref:hypothetical protein n=1 Tax=Cyanobium sp. Lug-B TaxID=2823716 RepID=UPI0020CD4135|nr:hypothetical protein [Cyanobium sp. Lug-B]MCP9797733.1 hypothetical protein [Cyanobium sp. Lug-B]